MLRMQSDNKRLLPTRKNVLSKDPRFAKELRSRRSIHNNASKNVSVGNGNLYFTVLQGKFFRSLAKLTTRVGPLNECHWWQPFIYKFVLILSGSKPSRNIDNYKFWFEENTLWRNIARISALMVRLHKGGLLLHWEKWTHANPHHWSIGRTVRPVPSYAAFTTLVAPVCCFFARFGSFPSIGLQGFFVPWKIEFPKKLYPW